jgi:RepB DNA-primase N-terminal domain
VQHFGADPAAVDTARVLRLPGFYNHKYSTPHFVRVENLSAAVYAPSQFPRFEIHEGVSQQPETRARKRAQGPITQSEKDWAYAMRALTRGEDRQEVIQAIAAFRTDKPDPHYYATHTVTKAAAVLSKTKQPQHGLSLAL